MKILTKLLNKIKNKKIIINNAKIKIIKLIKINKNIINMKNML